MGKSGLKKYKHPRNYDLIKNETLEDALVPQENKYPSGLIWPGFMWEHTYPEIGEHFYVHNSKTSTSLRTSPINEIIKENADEIIFKTWNSIYTIKFKN